MYKNTPYGLTHLNYSKASSQ